MSHVSRCSLHLATTSNERGHRVLFKCSTHLLTIICDFSSSKHHGTSEQGEIDHAGKRLDVSKREMIDGSIFLSLSC